MDTHYCHLCRSPLSEDELVTTPNGLEWCADLVECYSRARRRLRMPLHIVLDAKAADLRVLANEAEARGRLIKSLPPRDRDPEYDEYIASVKWERFADDQKRMAYYRCEAPGCGTRAFDVQVHHLNYRRFKRETPADVIVLCVPCHRVWDDQRRNGNQQAIHVTVTGDRRYVTLADEHHEAAHRRAGGLFDSGDGEL